MFIVKFITGNKVTRCTRKLRDYDARYHDIRIILSDMGEKMRRHTNCSFFLSGFGHDNWLLSLDYDLGMFVGDLEILFDWLDSSVDQGFVYNFARQGFEVELHFSKVGDQVAIKCWGGVTFQPKPEIETINKEELNSQLTDFLQSFIAVSKRVDPKITSHPWFIAWLNKPGLKKRLNNEYSTLSI
jgi:hypothetical protein